MTCSGVINTIPSVRSFVRRRKWRELQDQDKGRRVYTLWYDVRDVRVLRVLYVQILDVSGVKNLDRFLLLKIRLLRLEMGLGHEHFLSLSIL